MKIKRKILCISLCEIIAFSLISGSVLSVSGKVTGSSVRIREEANSSSNVISVAKEGENVDVIGQEDGWYKVNFEDITGYISSDFVDTDYSETDSITSNNAESNDISTENHADDTNETQVSTDNSNNTDTDIEINEKVNLENEINIRRLPNFSSKSNSNIASGIEVTVLDKLNNWVKITDGSITGWVTKENIKSSKPQVPENNNITGDSTTNSTSDFETSVSEDNNISSTVSIKNGVINVDSARVRNKPDGTILGVVDLNDKVEILEEDGDWYKVNVGEYTNCYISKSLVKVD